MSEDNQKELTIKRGSTILNYINRFSATEKAVFGVFVILAIISAGLMTLKVNSYFMVDVPARGGELREGVIGLPRTVNPVLAVTDTDKDISSLVYDGLLAYKGQKLIPNLAASYSVSDDGLTYDFKLKPDVRFHDGELLTADDVEYTITKIQDPSLKSPRRADWANVTVKKVSQTEIQFVLKQAYSPFMSNLTIGIIPKHIWSEVNDEQFIFSDYNVKPIGSGPYKVDTITKDAGGIPKTYRITSWSGYHGQRPYIDTITFHFFSDDNLALAALDAGTIDSLSSIPPASASELAKNSGEAYEIESSPLPRVFGVFFNQSQNPLLADQVVRQALNLSIDREKIIKEVLAGYGEPLYGPLPAGLLSDGGKDSAPITSSTSAAALLEKNGWKKGSDGIYTKKTKTGTTTLAFDIYTADAPDLKQSADILKDTWTTFGAKVNVRVFEASDLYQNVIRTRKYDALLFGEQIGKDRDVYAFWHSSQRNSPGLNISMYANSKADKALETIRSTNDEATRNKAYHDLDTLVRNDVPAVFTYSPDFIYAIPKNIKGADIGSITVSSDRFNNITSWYINTEKVWTFFK